MTRRYYCNFFKTDTHSPCCQEHDNAYGYAGVVERYDERGRPVYRTRAEADRLLRQCVIGKGLPVWFAWCCWGALRLAGWAWWKEKRLR